MLLLVRYKQHSLVRTPNIITTQRTISSQGIGINRINAPKVFMGAVAAQSFLIADVTNTAARYPKQLVSSLIMNPPASWEATQFALASFASIMPPELVVPAHNAAYPP